MPHIGCGISDTMVDSRHKQTYSYLSEIVDELFDQIAIRLDITSAIRLAACSKDFYRQVARSRCPNDLCWKLVAYHEVHDHKISCPHRPCTCTEPGCVFTAPPAALLVHLREAHSLEVHNFHYDKIVRYNSQPLPAPGSPRVQITGSGDDGMVFVVQFDTSNTETLVSVDCLRAVACLSPRYKVTLWTYIRTDGGERRIPDVGLSDDEEAELSEEDEEELPGGIKSWGNKIQFEATSSASPEELREHLKVVWTRLGIHEQPETMDYWLRIANIDETDNT